jgi:hypothetical protein
MRTHVLLAVILAATGCDEGRHPPPVPEPVKIPRTPVALAFLYAGNEIWCGNNEHETQAEYRYTGALDDLRAAFTHGLPERSFPPGSRAAVISYAEDVDVRRSMSTAPLAPDVFGVQRDYRGRIGTELGYGLERAVAMLEEEDAEKRVLVIVGDGNDLNNKIAREHFHELSRRLERAHITTYALVVPSALSPDGEIVSALTPHVETVRSSAEIPGQLAEIWRSM